MATARLGSLLDQMTPSTPQDTDVFIVSSCRTALGSFMGGLSGVPATSLGASVISAALTRAGVSPSRVDEVFMGQVLTAGCGQAPARQAALEAGIPVSVPCTAVNKVCASGLKAVSLAAQTIALGQAHCVVAGGMESMSRAPFYLPNHRSGSRLGDSVCQDALLRDGLTDNRLGGEHMGVSAELCAKEHNIGREQQDAVALESYMRAQNASRNGWLQKSIVPVAGVSDDEDVFKLKQDRMSSLKTPFQRNGGTVTAANASNINDGAAALVLVSGRLLRELGLTALAKVEGYADAATDPQRFTTAPALAIPVALARAGVTQAQVEAWEINEAFAVVSAANQKLLNLDPSTVNVWGGAIALGHPLGASGARILVTLLDVLEHKKAALGCAAICNGGGGATALVVRRV